MPLPSLLTNRGLLAGAWLVVLVALAGGATLILLQPPPPPPLGDPVVAALKLPSAEMDDDAQDDPESGDVAPPAVEEAATPAEASAAGAPAASAPEPPAEETVELPLVPTPPVTAPLPALEAPGEAAQVPETPTPEEQPEDRADQAETPAAEAPAAADEAPKPAADTLALPAPKPEAAAEAMAETPGTGEQGTGEQGAGEQGAGEQAEAEAGAEQVAAIPVIPPAPEQLPYWERYRQPFNMDDKRPRIAVVLSGLGLSDSATEAAINNLPPAITLSFSPYARDLERWIALARARGHEVMLDLPMEPSTFPNEDPGPQGLLVNLSAEDNLDRLDWVLSRGSAYVGLAGSMGSRFTASRRAMKPILDDVKARGLMFLDRRTTEESVVPEIALEIGLPRAINNRSVDERQASRVAIDARLAQIERIALTEGYAVAMAQPYPVTLERLADWATELIGRGFVIAPISALADQQKAP